VLATSAALIHRSEVHGTDAGAQTSHLVLTAEEKRECSSTATGTQQ
jgi:hypothetical protein